MPEQLDLLDYPNTPGWQRPETSIAAAEEIAPRVGRLRARVLAEVHKAEAEGRDGLTADEAAARLELSILTARPRCSELVKLGLLHDSGQRRPSDSGHPQVVWTTEAQSKEQVKKPNKSRYERVKGR